MNALPGSIHQSERPERLQQQLRIEIPFLKPDKFQNFFFCKSIAVRRDNPFVFCIVLAMYYADYPARKGFKRFVYTQNIYILFLSVRCENAGDIPVIDSVKQIRVFGMPAAKGSVYAGSNGFTYHKNISKNKESKHCPVGQNLLFRLSGSKSPFQPYDTQIHGTG